MRIVPGTIISGGGTDVYVLSRDIGEPARLSPDELAELEAGLAEADRDETISGEDLFERLRRHG